jgi:ABC-type multidrug transport system ATPase subunit
VPQDDIVHDDLTVLENLQYSADIRLPADVKPEIRKAIVKDVIDLLQIGHIKESIVGSVENRGISGGQRKRVNIGLEMCADPIVLFLDEPTSGLDSTSSEVVLGALKDLTELGLTVVTVIHQPRFSIFTRFDHVLLLGKGGRTVYSGPSSFALPYFQRLGFECPASENPADFLMDAISGHVTRKDVGMQLFEPKQLFDFWADDSRADGSPTANAGAAIFADLAKTTVALSLSKKDIYSPAERHMVVRLFHRLDAGRGGLNSNQLNTMTRVLEIMIDDLHFDKLIKLSPEMIEKLVVAEISQTVKTRALKRKPLANRVPGDAHSETFRPKQKKMLIAWVTDIREGNGPGGGAALTQPQLMDYLQSTETIAPNAALDTARRNSAAEGYGQTYDDITPRTAVGLIRQTGLFSMRALLKLMRSRGLILFDLTQIVLAACLVAIVNGPTVGPKMNDIQAMPTKMLLMILFFGALSMIGTLRTFNGERLIFW